MQVTNNNSSLAVAGEWTGMFVLLDITEGP